MKEATTRGREVDAGFGFVLSSVAQGDDLCAAAEAAGILINCGFGGLVMAPTPDQGYAERAIGDLGLVVIGPDQARVDNLRKKWERETRGAGLEALLARSASIAEAIAGEDDESVTNLSSIVFLARYGEHSILMTGDARGDYIIDGLARAGLHQDGRSKVDVLKLQHHGSARNADTDFFSAVLADHYVISANGDYRNPDLATFDALVAARGEIGYSVWMTNGGDGTPLASEVALIRAKYPSLDLRVRPAALSSLLVKNYELLWGFRYSPYAKLSWRE